MKNLRGLLRGAVCTGAALLCAVSLCAAAADPFGVVLSITGDPSASITAVWRGAEEGVGWLQVVPAADYAVSGFDGGVKFPAEEKDVSLDKSGAWHWEATADGLAPGTEYVYRVGREGAWSAPARFTTDDPRRGSTGFVFLGDIQTKADTQAEYARWGQMVSGILDREPGLSFGILGGDIVESGIRPALFDAFLSAASPAFSKLPLMAVNGNHESNFPSGKPELYLDYFALPKNGPAGFEEEFYSFTVGDCHVTVVNPWIFSGEQAVSDGDIARVNAWLAADLAASCADWQVVVTHVPVYAVAADRVSDAARANWEPILRACGADLVLEGHQHVYSRSYPLLDGAVDYENGITYIMGNSGQKFYSSADESFAARTVYDTATYQLVRTDNGGMTVQCCGETGAELDFCAVNQRGVDLTRGEFAKYLWQAAGSPAAGASPFRDTAEPWAAWAYEKGLLLGYGNGSFGPEDKLTDAQRRIVAGRMEGMA